MKLNYNKKTGVALVIVGVKDYIKEAERQLSNTEFTQNFKKTQ